MTIKDFRINNERTSFSKKIKRKVLLEIASGKSIQEAFAKCFNYDFIETSSDEKYAAKLLHKWRKEMYKRREILSLFHCEVDSGMIQDEIENMGEEKEYEFDLDEAIEDLKAGGIRVYELNGK